MRRRTRSSKRTTPAGPPGTAPRGRQPRAEPAAGGSYYRGMVATNDTRLAILKSAAAAFRRHGYHGATVEHIAVPLRMKKGNLYYYFRSKEDILFACHQYSLDTLLKRLEETQQSAAPADRKLRHLITVSVNTILDDLHGTAPFLDLGALSPAHRKAIVARRDRFERGLREVLQEGMDSGLFTPSDPKLLAFAILGAVNWIPRWFSTTGSETSQQIADRFADYFIAGLRREPAAGGDGHHPLDEAEGELVSAGPSSFGGRGGRSE